jgi:hypothetical protein
VLISRVWAVAVRIFDLVVEIDATCGKRRRKKKKTIRQN